MTDIQQPALSDAQRQELLNAEVARYVSRGYATETVSGFQAVVVKVKRMGWFWNVILTIFTGGLWLIYVIYRALNRKADRVVLRVDANGKIHRS